METFSGKDHQLWYWFDECNLKCKAYPDKFLDLNGQDYNDQNWGQVKIELASKFSDVVDYQHAFLLLRNVKQKTHESVQIYAERLLSLGYDAFLGQDKAVADRQLVEFLIDGLKIEFLIKKVKGSLQDI